MSGIYQIRCLVNNKIYIGSAVAFSKRFNLHKCRLRRGDHHSSYLQNAWNKYGEENFAFEILEEVEKNKLIEREQTYLDSTKSYFRENGFNQAPTSGSSLGRKDSEETKMKKAESRKTWTLSELSKKKISNSHKGVSMSIIARQNMSKNYNRDRKKKETHLILISPIGEIFKTSTIKECMEKINVEPSKRTTIYEVLNGRRSNINGWKINKQNND